MRYIVVDKRIGETPLEAIGRARSEHDLPSTLPACYAGRLDPMASGRLLVLLGEECKKLSKYTGLDKEYEIEVLLGVGSDTGDVLGVPSRANEPQGSPTQALQVEVGSHERAYPIFSSKTVGGKPLFLYALEGTLASIDIPTHTETIYRIQLLQSQTISHEELKERVEGLLQKAPISDEPSKALGADFRIKDVRGGWEGVLREERTYSILTLRVVCGSGTYMRSLAGRIGEHLGSKGLALSIHRTRIGRYFPFMRLWLRTY